MRCCWIAIAVMAAGCERNPAGTSTDGPELFAKLCTTCHGSDGKPPAAMVTRIGVRDLTDPALRARITPALVEDQLRRGSKNGLMPSFAGVLSEPQLAALAAYVASPAFLTPAPRP